MIYFPDINFLKDVILPILFSFFGAFLAISYTNSRTPNIKLIVGKETIFLDKEKKIKFLHVTVLNEKRRGINAFVRGNITSNLSQIEISWLDPKTNQKRLTSKARWSTQVEPLTQALYKDQNINFFDVSKAMLAELELIHPGQEKEIDIAVKKDGDKSFYFFNSWSYPFNFFKKDWEFDEKSIILKLKFYSESMTPFTKNFVLTNQSSSIDTFYLEEIKT